MVLPFKKVFARKRVYPVTRVLTDAELFHITATTLAEYEADAERFWLQTKGHDVSQNIRTLLHHIEGTHRFTILDLGCGPGRDLKTFTELGHEAVGVEGAKAVRRDGPGLQRLRSLAPRFSAARIAPRAL